MTHTQSDNTQTEGTNIEFEREHSIWYHNPNDNTWTENSYHQILSFNSSDEFWTLSHLFNKDFIENGMFFIMKDNIVPIWENDKNIDGGYISWKIDKKNVYDYWIDLVGHMLIGKLFNDNGKCNSDMINGCSISPKKNFNIIKLWTNCQVNAEELNFMDTLKIKDNVVAFKSHQQNIEKDTKMKQNKTNNTHTNNTHTNNTQH